ncbi:MAG TPA: hypothetical protein VJT16_16795 [Streptosporangiaceae bacterium]|nr:hypothetical protein [Streptosporangiaceae bacterium]
MAVRPSPIAGLGLFASAPIAADTVVSRLGGQLVSGQQLRDLFAAAARNPLRPYIDTIAVVGPYKLAARRDLAAGEELTNDYATSTAEPDFAMECSCGSPLCRASITGDDWRRTDLRERYGEHWVPTLLGRFRSTGV